MVNETNVSFKVGMLKGGCSDGLVEGLINWKSASLKDMYNVLGKACFTPSYTVCLETYGPVPIRIVFSKLGKLL